MQLHSYDTYLEKEFLDELDYLEQDYFENYSTFAPNFVLFLTGIFEEKKINLKVCLTRNRTSFWTS